MFSASSASPSSIAALNPRSSSIFASNHSSCSSSAGSISSAPCSSSSSLDPLSCSLSDSPVVLCISAVLPLAVIGSGTALVLLSRMYHRYCEISSASSFGSDGWPASAGASASGLLGPALLRVRSLCMYSGFICELLHSGSSTVWGAFWRSSSTKPPYRWSERPMKRL